jgi:membrane protease YdiL (CAAX protease family)
MADSSDFWRSAENLERRDNISPVSVCLLVLIIAWQFVSESPVVERILFHEKPLLHGKAETQQADADVYIEVDTAAKMAYVANLLPRRYRVASDDKALPDAVKQAESALRKNPLDPSLARRVILLRAELGDRDPLGAIPAAGKHRGMPAPIAAYGAVTGLFGERDVWIALFSHGKLKPATTDVARLALRIESLENIRWYRYPALHQLYLRAGNKAAADREMYAGAHAAAMSMLPVGIIDTGLLVAGFLGIVLLIHLVTDGRSSWRTEVTRDFGLADGDELSDHTGFVSPPGERPAERSHGEPPPDGGMWSAVAEPPGPRRLGAGDLFNVFVAYMFLFEVLALVVAGGAHVWARSHEAFVHRHAADVLLMATALHQALIGLVALALLYVYIKACGGNQAREVWFRTGDLTANIGYGLAAWAMSLPLVVAAAGIANVVFRKLPNPSNPAILMIMTSHGFLAKFVLFLMVCIFAPVVEEAMFRGAFYQAARIRLGVWPAILLTGVLFGSVHPVGVAGTVPLMVLGATFAWIAEKRKSLLPGMIGHMLQNTTSFLALIALYS